VKDKRIQSGPLQVSDPVERKGFWTVPRRVRALLAEIGGKKSSTAFRGLTQAEKDTLAPYIPRTDLDCALLQTGRVPWYLHKGFCGITRGHRIYLRHYDPSSIEDLILLGHELVHVGQYRAGMNWASYLWSARGGYTRCHFEKKAYAVEKRIRSKLGEIPNES